MASSQTVSKTASSLWGILSTTESSTSLPATAETVSTSASCLWGILASTETPTTRASERVFSIPELVENILDHITSPLQLFTLRRVNTVFKETISMSKYQEKMFLRASSTPKLRLFHITNVLRAKGLARATYPFKIVGFSYLRKMYEDESDQMLLRLEICVEWARANRGKAQEEVFGGQIAQDCKPASWQGVLIGGGSRGLRVDISNWHCFECGGGEEGTLAQILEACEKRLLTGTVTMHCGRRVLTSLQYLAQVKEDWEDQPDKPSTTSDLTRWN